jgi:TRAP-type C4-dicarboxylate transport system permease small subunit
MHPLDVPANETRLNGAAARAARRIGDSIADAFTYAAAFALLVIIAICAINVTRRYLFGTAWSWAEEAMVYLMIFIVFAGAVAVTWRNAHMRIELVVDRLPASIGSAVVFFGTLLAIGTLATMSYFSTQVVMMLYAFDQKTDALEMPMWIPQSFIAIGFGMFAALAALRLYVHGTARGQTELDVVAKDKL